MTALRPFAVLPLITSVLMAYSADFRSTTWGMDRAQVVAIEGAPPRQVAERGGEIVLRYESARFAGLDCRVVYIFAKDKLVRAKYMFQQEHKGKNDFLADFMMVEAFLMGTMDRPARQQMSWQDDTYKLEPQNYGLAISLGQLLYLTQWRGSSTVVTHALTGENGAVVHEVEYASVDLESWENQVTKGQEAPGEKALAQAAVAQ